MSLYIARLYIILYGKSVLLSPEFLYDSIDLQLLCRCLSYGCNSTVMTFDIMQPYIARQEVLTTIAVDVF